MGACGHWCTLSVFVLLVAVKTCSGCDVAYTMRANSGLSGKQLSNSTNVWTARDCQASCQRTTSCFAYQWYTDNLSRRITCALYSEVYYILPAKDSTTYVRQNCQPCNFAFTAMKDTALVIQSAIYSGGLEELFCHALCANNNTCMAYMMKNGVCFLANNVTTTKHDQTATTYLRTGKCATCVDTTTHLPNIQLQGIMTSGKTNSDNCGPVCMDVAHCHAYVVDMNKSCFLIHEYTNATRASGIDTYLVRHCESCPRTFSQSKNTTLTGTVLRYWGVLPETGAGSCLEKCMNDTRCTGYIIRNGDRACTMYSNSYLTETDQDTNYTAYLLSNCDVGCHVEFTPINQTLLTPAYSSDNSRFFSSTDNCMWECQQDVKCTAISTRITDNLCSIEHEYESRPDASYTSYTIQRCTYFDGNWGLWAYSGCSVTCGHGTRTKTRVCNNPAPTGKGMSCVGQATDVQTCIPQPCPLNKL